MKLKFVWDVVASAKTFARQVKMECKFFKDCQNPGDLHGIVEPIPIPLASRASVALDIFDMPMVKYE